MAATVASPVAHTELEPDRCGSQEESRGGAETTEEGGQQQPTGPQAIGGHSRLSKLPLARIKALMKTDPDVSLASQESVFIIAKATELFVEMIAKDALVYAQQGKRKTLQRKDLDNAIEAVDEFAFLEGKGVQMQRDVQCCMLYSHGKVRTKDVLRFEVQTEGPDCSIQAIILYTRKTVKCADPRDRKVKRLLRKLLQRQRTKAHRTTWLLPHDNLPVMTEDKRDNWALLSVE
ncbi:DNA polymerase epsilon subunit 4 [Dunckerocampus dactyliophorus]|uniref:DNA polymerase epsilon subunit 4 n=1 Tax=Dunckerocampus dactyliophorus TaxID=161453 RepID=UPI002406B2E6|nr:DNA polymerase epsilon subunit 4 [Dunckerocampus dactyliophorus]XP_054644956.1 DNA polymerase epsilon subunit 4 [Dunckerocampus dactyliophorus]XP_054644957.1 DNA polymerase epsilon subunit 4 [Dunckerocampus dactyliophorus]XP_054644958.1 DNA polymerase epsilon subunit 4 [Dunckerocampus dactyliophorus]XP_054644959.1 DNA polymerase epsilon subunit 4 [Dunckerocampus dactyliophorus]